MDLPLINANFETSLAVKISSTAGTLTLSRSTDAEGVTFAGQYILTVDEGTTSEEHMLVTLTGSAGVIDTRGLSRTNMTTLVVANRHAHDRGASVKITNTSLMIVHRMVNGDEAFPNNPQTLGDGSLLATSAAPTTDAMIANKKYVDDIAIAGAPDGLAATKGIYELASIAEASANAAAGSGDTTAALAITTALTSNTSGAAQIIPVTDADGDIPVEFMELDAVWAFTGNNTHAGTETFNSTLNVATATDFQLGGVGVTSAAGNQIDDSWLGLTTQGDILYRDGTNLNRLAIGTVGQVLKVPSGATAPAWGNQYLYTTTTVNNVIAAGGDSAEVTIFSTTLPANYLSTNGAVRIRLASAISGSGGANNHYLSLKLKLGGTTLATANTGNSTGFSGGYDIEAYILANGSSTAQEGFVSYNAGVGLAIGQGTGVEDTSGDLTLSMTGQWIAGGGGAFNATLTNYFVVIQ
jgi:hypothetical protein